MTYKGRISVVVLYISIVILWHSFYFIVDFSSAYDFLIRKGHLYWDFVFIPLLSPIFWWLGSQYDKAVFYSQKDYLTGLYNRRFIEDYFPKMASLAKRENKKIGLMYFDLDKFKLINDRFGHRTGDQMLIELSRQIKGNSRESDVAARWGGDEFLLFTVNVESMQDIEVIRQRIINGVNESFGKQLQYARNSWISIGISVFPDDAKDLENLLRFADQHMYKMKETDEI